MVAVVKASSRHFVRFLCANSYREQTGCVGSGTIERYIVVGGPGLGMPTNYQLSSSAPLPPPPSSAPPPFPPPSALPPSAVVGLAGERGSGYGRTDRLQSGDIVEEKKKRQITAYIFPQCSSEATASYKRL
jgi:hypothetical protein